MTFKITKRAKDKALKRRLKNEKKWKIWRIVRILCLIYSIYCFIVGIFIMDDSNPSGVFDNAIGFSVFLMVFVMITFLLKNLASGWIRERLNEHMWIEGDVLHHFWQVSFAAGVNNYNTDSRGVEFQLDLSTIEAFKHDVKSGRVEFYISGKQVIYKDFRKKEIEEVCPLVNSKYKHVCYDYYEPGLVETLKSKGIPCTEATLDFKIRQV